MVHCTDFWTFRLPFYLQQRQNTGHRSYSRPEIITTMDCPLESNVGVPLPRTNDEENQLDMGMNVNVMNTNSNIAHGINFNLSSNATGTTTSDTHEDFGLDYLEGNNVELKQQNQHQYNQQQYQQYQQYPTRAQIPMQYQVDFFTQKQDSSATRGYNSRTKSNSIVSSSSNGSPNSVPIQSTPVAIAKNNNNQNHTNSNQNLNNENPTPSDEELYQRRKAQNRAAQRAFRERKEGKLKELSNKLQEAEASREMLEKQLNDLKEKNHMLGIENQRLKQQKEQQKLSVNSIDNLNSLLIKDSNTRASTIDTGELQEILSFKFPNISKAEFIDGTIDWGLHGREKQESTHTIGESYNHENGKVLTISAVWDYLVEFTKLNDDYSVDITGIMDELRGREVCHGFGPAYPINLVNDIILRHLESE